VFRDQRTNIVGMLLVKTLLSHNPAEKIPIRTVELSPIPRFPANHSLFSIFHEFKLGKSHMGVVIEKIMGRDEPIGVVTLEDLIEELIQLEIADETDEVPTKSNAMHLLSLCRFGHSTRRNETRSRFYSKNI
jgi:CBS domain containing-hemolysin-like protein